MHQVFLRRVTRILLLMFVVSLVSTPVAPEIARDAECGVEHCHPHDFDFHDSHAHEHAHDLDAHADFGHLIEHLPGYPSAPPRIPLRDVVECDYVDPAPPSGRFAVSSPFKPPRAPFHS